MLGVACFDCHTNGHTSAATHLVGDIRPQENRRRIDTPSLRGSGFSALNGRCAQMTKQGPIKSFPLRGIKESPPYFHDGRLLTLEDTVEFFNLVLQTMLSDQEKADLVAFLRVL
jgi:cytochrome c peroxidase